MTTQAPMLLFITYLPYVLILQFLTCKRLVARYIGIFFLYPLFSQTTGIIHINSQDGLPTNAVTCLLKDTYGFYWIGTQNGLCKYDGYKIDVIKKTPHDSNSIFLSSTGILTLAQYQNYILIGCEFGIYIYDYIKNRFYQDPLLTRTFSDQYVYELYVHNEHLFIISEKGLYEFHLKTKKLIKYSFENKTEYTLHSYCHLFSNKLHVLMSDIQRGIFQVDTIQKTISLLSQKDYNQLPKNIKNIIQYGNNLYILHKYGLSCLDASTLQPIDNLLLINQLPPSLKSKTTSFNCILALNNKLYIGTNLGILEYDPLSSKVNLIKLKEYETQNEDIKALYTYDNNLIAITYENGLYIIPFSIKKFNNPVPDKINEVMSNTFCIQEYHSGKLLIGGKNKLLLYNILTHTIEKTFSKHFQNTTILDLIPSHEPDKYFVATWGKGLFLWDMKKEKLKKLPEFHTDNDETIRDFLSLYLDKDTLWCGTIQSGLFKFNIKTEQYIPIPLFNRQIINTIQKHNNHFLIGTTNGLYILDEKNKLINHLNTKNKLLPNDIVYQIIEDSNYFYIATDNGLALYDKTLHKSRFFNEEDGLDGNAILSVYKDKDNNLWMNTLKGISKMILKNIEQPHQKLFYNYSSVDGLVNYEYNQGAHCQLKNNFLVFGGTKGIDLFNPSKIKPSYKPVPVYVTAFKKNGKDYPSDTNILLKKYFIVDWRENNIQIELTAINPLLSSKTLYRYQLVGYDDEYSQATNIRYISYTGLPGGTYTLEIIATNHDGIWNTQPHSIYIQVIPPFWKTTWFMVTSAILLFGSIFGVNQYRTYQIKKQNRELEQKVKERTKELSHKNQEILSSLEYAKRIQQAILPTDKYVQQVLPDSFILYQPKDIVSGDFYWLHQVPPVQTDHPPSVIVAVIDCTGHGVPGALMSMIGNNLLYQIVIEKNITRPHQILAEMNKGIQTTLKQDQSDTTTNDGMDASIIHLYANGTLLWAGAYRPLLIIRANGEILRLEGDKYPLGGAQMDANRNYTMHQLHLQKSDMIYLFSDGYADQFGGEKGKKMMIKRFIEQLLHIHSKPLYEQKEILHQFFMQWQGEHEQVDDVLVIGIRYT